MIYVALFCGITLLVSGLLLFWADPGNDLRGASWLMMVPGGVIIVMVLFSGLG